MFLGFSTSPNMMRLGHASLHIDDDDVHDKRGCGLVKIKSRMQLRVLEDRFIIFLRHAVIFGGFLFLALIAGRLSFAHSHSFLSLPGLIIPIGADSFFCYQILFCTPCWLLLCWRVFLFAEFVSLSSYHLVRRALLVYVVLF